MDVICPSEYAIQKLIESDMLVALNYFDENEYAKGLNVNSDLYEHNSSNVDNDIINKINEAFGEIRVEGKDDLQNMTDYIVPYMYGTLGILYNKYSFMEMNIYDYENYKTKLTGEYCLTTTAKATYFPDELTGSILMKGSIRDSWCRDRILLARKRQTRRKTRRRRQGVCRYARGRTYKRGRRYADRIV